MGCSGEWGGGGGVVGEMEDGVEGEGAMGGVVLIVLCPYSGCVKSLNRRMRTPVRVSGCWTG